MAVLQKLRAKRAEKKKEFTSSEEYFVASQWTLMRRKFLRHKMAIIGIVVLGLFYLSALFCEFLAPYYHNLRFT